MADYYPILKGRKGELEAIGNIDDELAPHILPVFDVPPSDNGPIKDARAFSRQAQRTVPRDMAIAVDIRHLADPTSGIRRPLPDIAEDLHQWGTPFLPVAHLRDTPGRMADIREAAALHGHGAVLRLEDDIDHDEIDIRLSDLLSATELTAAECVLILDAAEVRSEHDLTRVEPLIHKRLNRVERHPWKAVALAAGAMPRSISHLPPGRPTPLRRWDLDLWRRLHDHGLAFADYGITHPQVASGRGRPAPNLRYTDHDVWWAYRAHGDNDGNQAIHHLCQALVSADHWPDVGRRFSWGDEQIALRASHHAGPGTPSQWISWGTSHHLAHVSTQLGLCHPIPNT
ncbi:beta family protein [Micromonospora robiginosa]|uniref:Beta family protein n=1 Tax=Micromonospora robiginosa TaxID=2749844 RepID=A0A7L6B2R0_9ACTN|nr:beta family protein [Micromonospora ferruginea]QLQ35930.1 beta family protein [Micromonospora ferruginea]